MGVLHEELSEPVPAVMEIRLDRAVGNPDVLRDLGDRQSTEVVKADRNPLLLWELRKRCSEVEQFGRQVCFEDWSDSRQDLSASSTVPLAIQQSMKRCASHPGSWDRRIRRPCSTDGRQR